MSFLSETHTLEARAHIQDIHHAKNTKYYWGYATRILPCTNDAGSCEYLDAVYWMHTVSMLYTFILWIVIGVILLFLIFWRLMRPERQAGSNNKQGFFYRCSRSIASASRQYLLTESFSKLFPHTSRVQVLILAILCIYLTAFSFIGIMYKTWVTPIKDSGLKNTRSGLGGFSDRVGAFAFALTPLTVALCSRDSILSLLTGIPYQNFNFLHRWTGRIILIQSLIHAISWTVIEAKLYQPQPTQYITWIKQKYMIWGIVAQAFIAFLFVFSLRPVIRWTGYEFFRKSHLVVAGLYLGACWGHWEQLACWMCASLIILGMELVLRFLRLFLIHFGHRDGNSGIGFRSIKAKMETFKDPSGTIVRMTFTHPAPWKIGQHFYLTFPALSIWQSHPFTVASAPPTTNTTPSHMYVIRARNGETGKLANLAESLPWDESNCSETPVVMLGPYGCSIVNDEVSNILTISGGTGISFTLPLITAALSDPQSAVENIEMIWIIRHIENLAWIGLELADLKAKLDEAHSVTIVDDKHDRKRTSRIVIKEKSRRFRIRIFVTRAPQTNTHLHALPDKEFDVRASSSSACSRRSRSQEIQDLIRGHPNFSVTYLEHKHPSVASMVDTFIDDTVSGGRTQVVGSGPAGLGTQIRAAVAARNAAGGVWRGDEKKDVECVWDDRLG